MAHDRERRRLEGINEMLSLFEWLQALGLARYISVFEENGVDLPTKELKDAKVLLKGLAA